MMAESIIDELKGQARKISESISKSEKTMRDQLQLIEALKPRAQGIMGGSCEAYRLLESAKGKASESIATLTVAKAKMNQWASRSDV
jgi:hypothetical protein